MNIIIEKYCMFKKDILFSSLVFSSHLKCIDLFYKETFIFVYILALIKTKDISIWRSLS